MSTVAEALGQVAGMPVVGLHATIQSVKGPYTGTSNATGKPYTNYKLTLQDQTGSIGAVWWDPTFQPLEWTDVIVSATNGKRGLYGVKVDEYQGKKNLSITGDCMRTKEATAQAPPQATSAPQSPAPVPANAQPAARHSAPQNGSQAPTLDGCLALVKVAHRALSPLILTVDASEQPEESVIGPMISTLLIAYTNGKLRFDPAEYALAAVEGGPEPWDGEENQ